jgi:putative protein-disulfide isomerase
MKLYYVHDPMCSWCWGFERTRKQLFDRLAIEGIEVVRLLGGLAPDSDEPMTQEMRDYLQQTWRRIRQRIPGTEFNFDFWTLCEPRRSTWPACRAVIAAREQGGEYDERMTRAIQEAYYLQARNPSEQPVLVGLAGELGLDTGRFVRRLNAPETQSQLDDEMQQGRAMNATSFPGLVLEIDGACWPVPVDYTNSRTILDTLHMVIDT